MSLIVAFRLVLASIGVYIAGTLSLAHGLRGVLACGWGAGSCAQWEMAKPESLLLGIPVAFLGLLGYIAIATATWAQLRGTRTSNPWGERVGYFLAAVGALVSLRLMFVQVFEIQAICIWCLASCVVMLLLLLTYSLDAARGMPRIQAATPGWRGPATLLACAVPLITFAAKAITWQDPPVVSLSLSSELLADIRPADLTHGESFSQGPIDSGRTFVLFFNSHCGPCEQELQELLTVRSRDRQSRILIRHMPSGPISEYSAFVSEIAREQRRFFAFLTLCYRKPPLTIAEVNMRAEEVGINVDRLKTRATDRSDKAWRIVTSDKALVAKIGLEFTPALILIEPQLTPRFALHSDLAAGRTGNE